MSRKTILTGVAVLAAILGLVGSTFGLTLNGPSAAAGLGAVLLYVFFEGKADIKRIALQKDKWKDPKFWITAVSAVLGALGTSGITLPISPDIIIGILTAIVTVLFKKSAPATT